MTVNAIALPLVLALRQVVAVGLLRVTSTSKTSVKRHERWRVVQGCICCCDERWCGVRQLHSGSFSYCQWYCRQTWNESERTHSGLGKYHYTVSCYAYNRGFCIYTNLVNTLLRPCVSKCICIISMAIMRISKKPGYFWIGPSIYIDPSVTHNVRAEKLSDDNSTIASSRLLKEIYIASSFNDLHYICLFYKNARQAIQSACNLKS